MFEKHDIDILIFGEQTVGADISSDRQTLDIAYTGPNAAGEPDIFFEYISLADVRRYYPGLVEVFKETTALIEDDTVRLDHLRELLVSRCISSDALAHTEAA